MFRLTRLLLLVVILTVALPGTTPAFAADDWAIPGGHFFTQTGGGTGNGYAVVDDANAKMWSEFQRFGGVNAVGYPASRRFIWDGFLCQAFQRVVFQWHPETQSVAFVNVFDQLHDLGKDDWLLAFRQTPKPVQLDETGESWTQIVAGRLALLDSVPAIKAQYYAAVGDPIQDNGLPTSAPQDMGNNVTVRAQRVVFQLWKVDVPWATQGTVTVALGGDIAKQAGILPDQSALQPEAPIGASLGAAKRTRGLFAITAHNVPFQPTTFTNPAVDGVVIRTYWQSVEPAPNQFDWSFVDSQVSQASAAGKKVILMVLPGAFSPSWALQGVQTAQFDSKYGFTAGQLLTQPIPWDQNYLNQWFTFVRVLGQRYDPNPSVVMVPMAGPTSISAEMSLPNGPDAIAQWQQLGYSPDKFDGAWAQTVSAYAQAFPNSQIGLALYPGLPIPDASASDQTRIAITASALAAYGGKVTIQSSGLSARKEAAPRLGYQLIQQYSGKTTVGFEMGTSATRKPDRMGGSDPVSALRSSIDFGLRAKPNFLEIYEDDIANPAMQDNLNYAHTALSQ